MRCREFGRRRRLPRSRRSRTLYFRTLPTGSDPPRINIKVFDMKKSGKVHVLSTAFRPV